MNRVNSSVIATLIVIIVVFFLGRLFFISSIQKEYDQVQASLAQRLNEVEALREEQSRLESSDEEDEGPTRSTVLLKPGKEPGLVRQLIAASGKVRLSSFEILESYFIKNENEQEYSMAVDTSFNPNDDMLELDEFGMPVGLPAYQDLTEWQGVEIVPVKFKFMARTVALGNFLKVIDTELPMNSVRSLDVILQPNDVVRGTIVLLFPLEET